MSESLTFVFPMPENLANARGHWRRRYRSKTELWDELDMRVLLKMLPKPVAGMPWISVTVRSVMVLGNPSDDDNAVARHKSILDWLKKHRYIVDDRRKNLRWESFPEQRISRKEPASITLTITKQGE